MHNELNYHKYPEFSLEWCLLKTIEEEGGAIFTNDEKDSGGPTKYGITQRFAEEHGYKGSVEFLTLDEAIVLGKKGVWDKMHLDQIHTIAPPLAYMLYDAGYNCGWKRAGQWFQQWLTINNNGSAYYEDIVVDGYIGNASIYAFNQYLNKRGLNHGIRNLVWSFLGSQSTHYRDCALKNEKNERFIWGWTNRVDTTFNLIVKKTMPHLVRL